MKKQKTIILIDGHNLLFRMFYGIPASIKNTKGKEIRGLIGFIGSLKKIAKEWNPYSLLVIFDSETSKNNNLKIDTSYKANRIDYTNIPEEKNPFSQLPLIKKALDYVRIPYLEIEKDEADDYIASVVTNPKWKCYQFIIVSTDTDFIQLVNKNTHLYVPRGKKSILYNDKEVIKKYNILSKQYVIFKSLVGDRADNIKGVQGIGNKTAIKILQYGSIENYVLHNETNRITKILLKNEKVLERNKKLIYMKKSLDVTNLQFQKLAEELSSYKTYEIIERIGER